jgi:uncharacterized membrane protein YraQ (UPF0718 family)
MKKYVKPLYSDPVFRFLAAAWGVLLWMDHSQAMDSLMFTGQALAGIAPFFLLAILFAAWAKASGADQLIARAFSGNPVTAVLAASLAGALSPFCSCGVVPLIAAMLAAGVPLPPVMAFCMASPVMDPEMFILTAAGIDLGFAVAKTITALGMGLLAGSVVWTMQRLGFLQNPLKQIVSCGCGTRIFAPGHRDAISWRFWQFADARHRFWIQIRDTGLFLGKWMTLAFFIESLMLRYLPAESVRHFVGPDNPMAVPAASLIGIPAYMNGYAAIPMIAGLMNLGMTSGAALAFMTAGAVSSVPAAVAVYALVRKSVFFAYIVLGIAGAVIAGYGFEFATTL